MPLASTCLALFLQRILNFYNYFFGHILIIAKFKNKFDKIFLQLSTSHLNLCILYFDCRCEEVVRYCIVFVSVDNPLSPLIEVTRMGTLSSVSLLESPSVLIEVS